MWLYPIPVFLVIAGWIAIFLSTGIVPIVSSLVAMTVGVLVYLIRARMLGQWPFETALQATGYKEIPR
jgi:fructoselysine transporter